MESHALVEARDQCGASQALKLGLSTLLPCKSWLLDVCKTLWALAVAGRNLDPNLELQPSLVDYIYLLCG